MCAAMAPFLSAPVLGQQAQAPRTETVIVTASALRQSAGEVVQGVSVLSGAELTAHSFSGLGETLEALPGVASTFFGAAASRPIIRGLGEDRIRVLSNGLGGIDASTASPDHAVTADGLEAQTVEVLRGPAALVYGGNAIGGVVNVVDERIPTTVPDRGWGVDGSLGANSADGGRFVSAAAVTRYGKLLVRLAGFERKTEDYEIPGFAQSSILRQRAGAAGLPLSPERGTLFNSDTEAKSGTLGVAWVDDWGSFGVSAKVLANAYGLPNGPPIFDTRGQLIGVADGPAEGGRIDMKQTRLDGRIEIKQGLAMFDTVSLSFGGSNYRHVELEPDGEVGTRFTNRGYEARLQATTKPLGGWTGVYGVTGLHTDFAAIGEEAFLPPTTTDEFGAFAVQHYKAGRWGAEFGGRLDSKKLTTDTDSRSFTVGSVSGALVYRPVEPAFLSLTLSRTERAPTDQELFADGPHAATQAFEIGDRTLRKEVASSIEVTGRWTSGFLSAEMHVWHIDFDGFIAFVSTGATEDGLPVYQSIQRDARFSGGEATISSELARFGSFAWSADLTADLVRAQFTGGGNVPRIPAQTLRLGTSLEGSAWKARVEVERAGRQSRTSALELPTEGYTSLHASLTWHPLQNRDRLALVLDGQNLTDEDIRVSTSFLKDVLPRQGRSIRLVLKSAF